MNGKDIVECYEVTLNPVTEENIPSILEDIVDDQYLQDNEYVVIISHQLEGDSLVVHFEVGASESSQIDLILYDLGFSDCCKRVS